LLLIVTHTAFALAAVLVGVYIFLTKKGTARHKLVGRFWVVLLTIVSMSAIPIQSINPGQYSLIHLFIPFTIGSLIYSIWSIKRFKVTRQQTYRYAHMRSMIGVYVGALLIAGAFTLLPGRFLYGILFG
tara:strand:- start:5798 stop:6184 length:387 start_codon:yes stop_codon:yes gene_type:complete